VNKMNVQSGSRLRPVAISHVLSSNQLNGFNEFSHWSTHRKILGQVSFGSYHLHLVPRLNTCGAIPQFSNVFMEWCLI